MLEEAGDASFMQQRRDRMEVTHVQHHDGIRRRYNGIIERAQNRRRSRVHQEEWFRTGPVASHGLHAGHAGGDLRCQKAEALEADATLDLFSQVVEPKSAVADPRRSRAMVEDRHGDCVEDGADAKCSQRL